MPSSERLNSIRVAKSSMRAANRLGLILILVFLAPSSSRSHCPSDASWSIAQREIHQKRGTGHVWQIDYALRNTGSTTQVLSAEAMGVEIEGWVSNARAAGHGTPRRVCARLIMNKAGGIETEVFAARDEANRCAERASLFVWPAEWGEAPPSSELRGVLALSAPLALFPTVVPPGKAVHVRIELEHMHFLYGPYEPLLGPRDITIHLSGAAIHDRVELDKPRRTVVGPPTWPAFDPPADRLDRRVYLSAPHSLHLSADIPGLGYYRMSGPVRYGTTMRLTFWYLVARGTEADARASVSQLKLGPGVWESLGDGQQPIALSKVGCWTRVEREFRTESQATNLTIEFRLDGSIGDLWIDELQLEPLESGIQGP